MTDSTDSVREPRTRLLRIERRASGWQVSGDHRHVAGHDPVCATGADQPAFNLQSGWQWTSDTLRAWSDPTGFVPVFYHAGPDEFLIATSLVALLKHRPEARLDWPLDWDALSVFMRVGFFLGEDTPFAGIRVLPPCARLHWADGVLHVEGGFEHPRPLDIPRTEAIERYAELFRAAVRRRPIGGDAAVVPLSAGRDSRHIAFELHAAGWRPAALTGCRRWPAERDAEGRLASITARRLGFEHRMVRLSSGLAEEAAKNRLTHFCADEHGWYLALARAINGHYGAVYDGLGGDVLSNGMGFTPERLTLFRRDDLTTLADDLLGPPVPLPYVGRSLACHLDYDRARTRLVAELARHRDAPNPVASFLFWNRTRREIGLAPLCMLGEGIRVQLPYMDADLVAFLRTLPAERFGAPGLHDEAIAHAFPQFADIPFEGKQPAGSPGPTAPRRHAEAVRAALDLAAHLRSDGGGAVRSVNWPWVLSRTAWTVLSGRLRPLTWWNTRLLYLLQLQGTARPCGAGLRRE